MYHRSVKALRQLEGGLRIKLDDSTVPTPIEQDYHGVESPESTYSLLQTYFMHVLSRKSSYFYWVWATLIGCFIAGRGFPQPLPTILALLAILAITSCVYIYNDVTDFEMDKINPKKNKRPLPAGLTRKEDAKFLIYITGFIGVALSLFLNPVCFVLTVAYLVLFIIYSHPAVRLKKMFIVKELTVASGHIMTTLTGGFAVAGTFDPTFVFAGILYFLFTFMGMPAFHDITDMKEDDMYGVRTMAIVLSWRTKVQMLMLFILAMMTLTPFTYTRLGFNAVLPIIVVAMGIIVLRYLIPLSNAFEKGLFLKTMRVAYVYYFSVHIALVVGILRL